jgi:hypothetical protein
MALITNDLAFFSDHGVAALGAGVKKFFGFIDDCITFDHPAEVQQRRQWSNLDRHFRIVFAHKAHSWKMNRDLSAALKPA